MENNTVPQPEGKLSPTVIGVIAILVIIGGAFMFLSSKSATPAPTDSLQETTVEDQTVPQDDTQMEEVTTIEVQGGSFYFKPKEIRVTKGEKVKIVLNSVDLIHDFVIDELNVKSEAAKGGSSTSVEFTPDQVGEFEFYCTVGEHRANGMVGKLIVEEKTTL